MEINLLEKTLKHILFKFHDEITLFHCKLCKQLQYVCSMKQSKKIHFQNEDYRTLQHPRETDSKNNLYVFVTLEV